MTRTLSLSIDLDAVDLYMGIHGLSGAKASERAIAAVPARAAERFGELCDRLGVKGTVFVVGRDLAAGRGHDELRALHQVGHELASHSFAHDYALSRRAPDRIDEDLARAEQAIEALCGARPVGFRAPGYTLSAPLIQLLRSRGYAYDSSLLPSPAYYAAKAAVMGLMALGGRSSRSILGDPSQLVRSRQPHVLDGLCELPVAVTPGLRVPFIGTLITQSPPALVDRLARSLDRDTAVVIELHGIDLCDLDDGFPTALAERQPDLRVPLATKRERLERVLRSLLASRQPVPLAALARLSQQGALE